MPMVLIVILPVWLTIKEWTSNIYKNLQKNLKRLRKKQGIKQDDFLAVEGISRSMISMIETAKTDITLSKIKIIADVLKLPPKDLLDFDD